MANNYSPVPPFQAAAKLIAPSTPSGLSLAGYQQFAQLHAAQGVAPVVSQPPTVPPSAAQQPSTGAFVFNPSTNTLHVYNGTKWVSTVMQ